MVFVAVLVALGIAGAVYSVAASTSVGLQNRRAHDTSQALIKARNALIGRAVSDANRPGSLPCPDIDNDGNAESPVAFGGVCPSYIGRLPWRTLGLPDLRDPAGERLWYALSSRFRDDSSAEPIYNDLKGNITIYLGNASTVQTAEAVAVVFAPGAITGSQVRNASVNAACAAPSGTIPTTNCAANYLETAFGVNNAVNAGPYISALSTATFNDRLLIITTAELMTPVEQRAAKEILSLLQSYRNAGGNWCACYPWADFADGRSNEGRYYGRVPLVDAETPSTPRWSDLGITVPSWLTNNYWWWVIFYTVSGNESAVKSGGTLTVDGVSGTSIVLITPGPAGTSRPLGLPPSGPWQDSDWLVYIEDSQNSDFGNTFIAPSSTAYARDRLYKQ